MSLAFCSWLTGWAPISAQYLWQHRKAILPILPQTITPHVIMYFLFSEKECSGDQWGSVGIYTPQSSKGYLLVSHTDNYRRRHKPYAVICIKSDIPESVRLAVAVNALGGAVGPTSPRLKKTREFWRSPFCHKFGNIWLTTENWALLVLCY